MPNLAVLTQRNADRWGKAKLTRDFGFTAKKLMDGKARYQAIEKRTGVPWFVIACIHEREASQSWAANIAQDDPWNRVSIHVPKGRGPFRSWEEAACDALVNCEPHAALWRDWSAGGALCLLEQYNGLGYAARGLPSPYIWSGTDQYVRGKYVRDGVFDPMAVDRQLGCAGLIQAMMQIDPTIVFEDARRSVQEKPPPDHPKPASDMPPQRSALAAFLFLLVKLFRKR